MEQSRVVKELVAMWARNSQGNLMLVPFAPPVTFCWKYCLHSVKYCLFMAGSHLLLSFCLDILLFHLVTGEVQDDCDFVFCWCHHIVSVALVRSETCFADIIYGARFRAFLCSVIWRLVMKLFKSLLSDRFFWWLENIVTDDMSYLSQSQDGLGFILQQIQSNCMSSTTIILAGLVITLRTNVRSLGSPTAKKILLRTMERFLRKLWIQITIQYALDLITGNQFFQFPVDVYFAISRASTF